MSSVKVIPRRSWTLGGPVIFTSSSPDAADGKPCARIPMQILRSGERPDWITRRGSEGRIYQAEGNVQARAAVVQIQADKVAGYVGDTGVVTNLGIDPAPFLALGVTTCFVECYPTPDDLTQAQIPRMRWAAKSQGWPYVIPTLGVFDEISFQVFVTVNGGPSAFAGGHWHGGPMAIYLAEGMTDTDSWGTLAQVCAL